MNKQDHRVLIERQLDQFSSDKTNLESALTSIEAAVLARLRDDGLNYHLIKSRVKSVDSIREKLQKSKPDGTRKYGRGIVDLDDLLGVRVITYIQPDVKNVVAALTGQFQVIENIDKGAQRVDEGVLGYAAHHLVLEVPAEKPPQGCAPYVHQRFEVQVKTVLQHAWAEFEHDVRYKTSGTVPPAINRAFTLASGLIELADNEFVKIQDAVVAAEANVTPPEHQAQTELSAEILTELLAVRLSEYPRSRKQQYDWLLVLLNAMNISSIETFEELLSNADWKDIDSKMQYKFPAGQVRIMDDFLLLHFGQDYIEGTKNLGEDAGRETKLKYRLSKLNSD